jgi:hypothetical protein
MNLAKALERPRRTAAPHGEAGQMEAGKMEAEQMEAGQLEAGKPGDWDFSPNSALFPQISQAFSTVSCLKALQKKSLRTL